MTADEAFAELTQLTGMTREEWADFFCCTPAEQAVLVEGYRTCSWAKPKGVTLARVLTVVGIIAGLVAAGATVVGLPPVVAGIASAAGALQSLDNL